MSERQPSNAVAIVGIGCRFPGGVTDPAGFWRLLVDGQNPIARTNVAPVVAPPREPALYGFSYTVPADPAASPTFVVAGSGELRPGTMGEAGIVRRGETTPAALAEKAAHVMAEQVRRLEQEAGIAEPSTPQISIGSRIGAKLRRLERRLRATATGGLLTN